MKIYKVIMKGGWSEENLSTYSIEDTDITYESVWYASRDIAERQLESFKRIWKRKKNEHLNPPRIVEQDVYYFLKRAKKDVQYTSRSNY